MAFATTFWFLNPLFLLIVLIIIVLFVISKFKWRKLIEEVKNHKEDANRIKSEIFA